MSQKQIFAFKYFIAIFTMSLFFLYNNVSIAKAKTTTTTIPPYAGSLHLSVKSNFINQGNPVYFNYVFPDYVKTVSNLYVPCQLVKVNSDQSTSTIIAFGVQDLYESTSGNICYSSWYENGEPILIGGSSGCGSSYDKIKPVTDTNYQLICTVFQYKDYWWDAWTKGKVLANYQSNIVSVKVASMHLQLDPSVFLIGGFKKSFSPTNIFISWDSNHLNQCRAYTLDDPLYFCSGDLNVCSNYSVYDFKRAEQAAPYLTSGWSGDKSTSGTAQATVQDFKYKNTYYGSIPFSLICSKEGYTLDEALKPICNYTCKQSGGVEDYTFSSTCNLNVTGGCEVYDLVSKQGSLIPRRIAFYPNQSCSSLQNICKQYDGCIDRSFTSCSSKLTKYTLDANKGIYTTKFFSLRNLTDSVIYIDSNPSIVFSPNSTTTISWGIKDHDSTCSFYSIPENIPIKAIATGGFTDELYWYYSIGPNTPFVRSNYNNLDTSFSGVTFDNLSRSIYSMFWDWRIDDYQTYDLTTWIRNNQDIPTIYSVQVPITQDSKFGIKCIPKVIRHESPPQKANADSWQLLSDIKNNDGTHTLTYNTTVRDSSTGKILGTITQSEIYNPKTGNSSWSIVDQSSFDSISYDEKDHPNCPCCFVYQVEYTMVKGDYLDVSTVVTISSSSQFLVSLAANPTEVAKGATSTISYSVLNASTSTPCTTTSTDNVWQPAISLDNEGKATGSEVVTLPDFKTYEFGLTCYDKDHNPKTATTTVNVTETTKKYNCDTREGCLESTTGTLTKSQCDSDCKYHCINGSSGSVCDLKYSLDSTKTLKTCSTTADCLPPRPSCNLTLTANPSRIILGQDLNLIWSVGDNCDKDTCQATVTPETGGNWSGNPYDLPTTKLDTPALTYNTTSVKPTKADTYTYTLQCDGKNAETIAGVANIDVRVIPLPFWREIIPNLQGFLRGLVR